MRDDMAYAGDQPHVSTVVDAIGPMAQSRLQAPTRNGHQAASDAGHALRAQSLHFACVVPQRAMCPRVWGAARSHQPAAVLRGGMLQGVGSLVSKVGNRVCMGMIA